MRRGRAYLVDELASIGMANVHEEDVSVLGWNKGSSSLELLSPCRMELETVHHVHTAAGEGTACIVDAGAGDEGDFERLGERVRGAVAVFPSSIPNRSPYEPLLKRVLRAADRGACAVIVQNGNRLVGAAAELVGITEDVPVPVLGISYEQGQALLSLVRRGASGRAASGRAASGRASLHYSATGSSFAGVCGNVIGELVPENASGEVLINSSHLDTQIQAPGSFDDLTGIAAMLEVARALAPFRGDFRRTLRFISYTGEEFGFIGSKAYVERHRSELDNVRFVLNFDELTAETAKGAAVMWSEPMCEFIREAFRSTQRTVDVRNFFCFSSDYVPFMLSGVPAARPADFSLKTHPTVSHTKYDTPDKVDYDWIRLNAMNFAQLLYAIAVYPGPLPAQRNSPEEVSELVDREGIRQVVDSMDLASLLDGNS